MLAMHSKIFISFNFLSSFFSFFFPLSSHLSPLPPLLSLPLLSPQRLHWKFECKERPRKPKATKQKRRKQKQKTKKETNLHQKKRTKSKLLMK